LGASERTTRVWQHGEKTKAPANPEHDVTLIAADLLPAIPALVLLLAWGPQLIKATVDGKSRLIIDFLVPERGL
jgi:hypothetical protein